MGATSRYDEVRGVCVSTGKLAPGGEEHGVAWGPWQPDTGWYFRRCVASDWCETEQYVKELPKG